MDPKPCYPSGKATKHTFVAFGGFMILAFTFKPSLVITMALLYRGGFHFGGEL